MKIRKFNIDRMRRNVARSTPDKICRKFDTIRDDYMIEYKDWITRFGRKMEIKHNRPVRINVWYDDNRLGQFPDNVQVTAQAIVKEKVRYNG